MSLILEALKKSERQRRLGETPSIGSPIMAVRERRNWMPYLIVLIIVGLAVLWWLKRDVDEPPVEPPRTANSAPAPVEPGAEAARKTVSAADTRRPSAPVAAPTVATNGTILPAPTAPSTRDKTNANPPHDDKFASGELVAAEPRSDAPSQPLVVKEAEAVPAVGPAAAPARPGNTDAIAIGELLNRADARAAAERADAGTATPTPGANAPAPVEAKPGDALALIWELPLATRRDLPEIKLTMHVYAEDPAQRFIIVNGERHAEGDDVGSLKLIEIRKDGVVFQIDKQRFLYPRGGR
ncbi:MAG: general secretion pathway protein GspB [Dokdonella sp.]|uniref:general secretion pathway protein GspB n=1 Tax=Dokdonella sp. TaxID=2291710 RepID=UPI003BB13EED